MREMFQTAIINAGGKSTRMGIDKAFIKINGKTMIEMIIANIKTCFEEVILVTNEPAKYSQYQGITVVEDCVKGIGPIMGLYTGLKAAHSQYSFFIACDMPIINHAYIEFMKQEIINHNYDAVITQREKGVEPFHAFYAKGLEDRIAENINQGIFSFYTMMQKQDVLYVPEEKAAKFDEGLNFFTNFNAKEDFCKENMKHFA